MLGDTQNLPVHLVRVGGNHVAQNVSFEVETDSDTAHHGVEKHLHAILNARIGRPPPFLIVATYYPIDVQDNNQYPD